MNKSFYSVALSTILALVANPVLSSTWGTSVEISSSSPCCGSPVTMSDYSSDGGEFDLSAFTSLSDSKGSAQGTASFTSSNTYLPTLGAEAFSDADLSSRVETIAVGMMGFTYTGSSGATITLDISLDGMMGGTASPLDAWVNSDVIVVAGNVTDFITDYSTFRFEAISSDDIIGESNLSLSLVAGMQTLNESLNVLLNPGDQFFVWAGIEAGGKRGGYGDAFNTLSMSFSDDTGINATVVPVPAAAWLFATGLLMLVQFGRSKQ